MRKIGRFFCFSGPGGHFSGGLTKKGELKRMNNHWALITLHELDGIGWKTIRRLVDAFPDLCELPGIPEEVLCSLGIPSAKAGLIVSGMTAENISRVQDRYSRSPVVPVVRGHVGYPSMLEETSQPPWVLYTRGRLELLERPGIAVVGTRTPTVYGKRMAEVFARDLSRAGVCVVSGLARGIDGAAHQGALEEPGGTIAVLGCGIDIIYPREHSFLYHQIAEKGLILSEYPPGMQGSPGLFPQRNRIIAGLSLGTFVVEAALKSGSLITADQALDESRDVFALPGPVTSPKSTGTNSLIQQGAKLVTCAADILQEYKDLAASGINPSASAKTTEYTGKLSVEEERILALLAEGPASIDDLIERLQTNFGHLHAILLSLTLKKRIEQLPGSVYILL
jgi:DNA processing protein